jgi:hypothetical protein
MAFLRIPSIPEVAFCPMLVNEINKKVKIRRKLFLVMIFWGFLYGNSLARYVENPHETKNTRKNW